MARKQYTWVGLVDDPFYFFGMKMGGDIGTKQAQDVIDYLEEDKENTAHIVISTNGGNAFIATRMVDMLSPYQSRITMEIAGLSASAGSLLAFAVPDELYIRDASMTMIHGPSGVTIGTLQDHKNAVQRMEAIVEVIEDIYTSNSKLSEEQVQTAVANELWLTPKDMIKYGVAVKILKPNKKVKAIIEQATNDNDGDRDKMLLHFPTKQIAAALQVGHTEVSLVNTSKAEPLPDEPTTTDDALDQEQHTPAGDTKDNGSEQDTTTNDDITGLNVVEVSLKQENKQLKILIESLQEEIVDLRNKLSMQGKDNQKNRNKESIAEALRTGRISPSEKEKWEQRLEQGGEMLRQSMMDRPPSDFFVENGVAFDKNSIESVPTEIRTSLEGQGYKPEQIVQAYKDMVAAGEV